MPYEYAISAGEGTLIAHGVCDGVGHDADGSLGVLNTRPFVRLAGYVGPELPHIAIETGETLIIAPCPPDCTTGA